MTKLEAWIDRAKSEIKRQIGTDGDESDPTLVEAIAVIEKLKEALVTVSEGYHTNIQECMNLADAALAIGPEKL